MSGAVWPGVEANTVYQRYGGPGGGGVGDNLINRCRPCDMHEHAYARTELINYSRLRGF